MKKPIIFKNVKSSQYFIKGIMFVSIVLIGIISIIATGPIPIPSPLPSWKIIYTDSTAFANYSGIWGTSPTDIWAFGPRDRMLHGNGTTWTNVTLPTNASNRIEDVWGISNNDIWAVGDIDTGQVLHWNGTLWTVFSTPDPYPLSDYRRYPLLGIGGSATNDVWIVGEFGKILHWNGFVWSISGEGSTRESLFDIWAFSADNAWAVGDNGTILHWNGSLWTAVNSGSTNRIYSIWATEPNDMWAVGDFGAIYHYNGATWTLTTDLDNRSVRKVWGINSTDIWTANFDVMHWDGTSWSLISPPGSRLNCVWSSQPGEVWGVYQKDIYHYK